VAAREVTGGRLSVEIARELRGTPAATAHDINMMTIESNVLDTITGGATGNMSVNVQSGDPYAAYNACAVSARTRGESQEGAAKFFHHIDPTGITGKALIKSGDARVAKECGWMIPKR
jgi:hypothetical protein